MNRPPERGSQSWAATFRCAFRGLVVGVVGQWTFYIHFLAAAAVASLATWLQVDAARWAVLLLTMMAVLTAEYLNSAIEILAKAVTRDENPHVRDALDVASGAVLCACLGAVAVGLVILGPPLWQRLFP